MHIPAILSERLPAPGWWNLGPRRTPVLPDLHLHLHVRRVGGPPTSGPIRGLHRQAPAATLRA
jgi:hypothetical protein